MGLQMPGVAEGAKETTFSLPMGLNSQYGMSFRTVPLEDSSQASDLLAKAAGEGTGKDNPAPGGTRARRKPERGDMERNPANESVSSSKQLTASATKADGGSSSTLGAPAAPHS